MLKLMAVSKINAARALHKWENSQKAR